MTGFQHYELKSCSLPTLWMDIAELLQVQLQQWYYVGDMVLKNFGNAKSKRPNCNS